MMQKYALWILAGAVLILGFSQWRSCRDNTANILSAEKKVIQHQRDSISQKNISILAKDSVLNTKIKTDSVRHKGETDSLKSEIYVGKLQFQKVKFQLSQTVQNLSDIINNGSDTALISELRLLKDQLNSANGIVIQLQTNTGLEDSVMTAELSFKDSVIQEKDKTIQNLKSNYQGMQFLVDQANADLDVAIKQLQKRKRLNVFRTVGEVALVIGLLFKK